MADARHRLILHNLAGIALAVKMFGDYTFGKRDDGTEIKADNYFIGVQHVVEDFGRDIGTDEVLEFCAHHAGNSIRKFNSERALDMLVKKHKGSRSDYQKIVDFFDHYKTYAREPNQILIANAFLCNSFGIFQLEKMLGPLFTRESDTRIIPTRILGENYIQGGYGKIPTLNEILELVPQRSWMQVNAAALSYQFDNAQKNNSKLPDMEQRITPFPIPLA